MKKMENLNGEDSSKYEDVHKPVSIKSNSLIHILREKFNNIRNNDENSSLNSGSPLNAFKTFEEMLIHPNLIKGLYAEGFNMPSKIQEKTLPLLLADPPKNLIAQSQSGTGKTASFVLAMLSRVDTSLNFPQVICLSPTYELAIQTGEICTKIAKFMPDISIVFAVRGEQAYAFTQIRNHIIIGTPGKVLDWGVKMKNFDISKIRTFVLDEADMMVSVQGQHDQCIRIHKKLHPKCQMIFFSATYGEEVLQFAQHIVPNPNIIRLLRDQECLDNIKQFYVRCQGDETKYIAIRNIYGGISIGQAIIFCNSRSSAKWLARKMSYDGHSVGELSGEYGVEDRFFVLRRFRQGLEKVLVTTNVLSRGIDIVQVSLVINFHMPMDVNYNPDYDTYLHRIGRTGRFGKTGIAINLIDNETEMKVCRSFETYYKKPIHYLNTDDFEEIEKIGS